MKRFGLLLTLLIAGISCYAQTAAISATVVDTDGTTWANGSWKIAFVPNPAQPNINVYNINGTPLAPSVINQSGSMDGSGNLAITVYQNQVVSPAGSGWLITVCPNAVTQCGTYQFTANSSTLNLSSILTTVIPAPRFHPISGAFGYTDSEAVLSLQPGSTYWNVTSNSQRCYGTTWSPCNSNSSGVTSIIQGTNITCSPLVSSSCTGNVTINSTGGGGGSNVSIVPVSNPAQMSGLKGSYDPIQCNTHVCDIRCYYGQIISPTVPIDPGVQACVSLLNSQSGGSGIVRLPCTAANTTGPGCLWNNPSALTAPSAGEASLEVEGGIQFGSTASMPGWMLSLHGHGNSILQFQNGSSPATFFGPNCSGTLGTAITAIDTPIAITPTFSGNVYGGGPACSIANYPVGSAITIAGIRSSTATALRIGCGSGSLNCPGGYELTTYTLTGSAPLPRIAPGSLVSITGCSDSTFNLSNTIVSFSDYPKQTIEILQTGQSPNNTINCIVAGSSEDEFENARVLSSNGVAGTFNGVTYTSAAGQITIMTKFQHLSTDLYGEVGAGPAFNAYTGQTWSDINVIYSTGTNFWAEGATNLTLENVGVSASANITSAAAVLSANYFSWLHNVTFQAATQPHLCPTGGCSAVSNPYALICDSDAPVGSYYSAAVSACDNTFMDKGMWLVGGGLKLGDGTQQIAGVPQITSLNVEEPWINMIVVDNRKGIQDGNNCLTVDGVYAQDNIDGFEPNFIGYTDNESPSGCTKVNNLVQAQSTNLTNQYFNGRFSVNDIASSTPLNLPPYLNAPSPTLNEGGRIRADLENRKEDFGPEMVPYGSLPMATYTLASIQSLCVSAGCTASAVVGPDGPNGKALSVEVDTANIGADIQVGTDSRILYPGDYYILYSHMRPGENSTNVFGFINTIFGVNNGFYISTGDGVAFAPTQNNNNNTDACTPGAFGTSLSSNGWSTQVATCGVVTGSGGSTTNIGFHLDVTDGLSGETRGNQYAEYGWAFIPGPNNPACTAAKTCNLSLDQIELAREYQYHGCIPPGTAAGTLATCESINSLFGTKINCLTTACAGGSTYSSGTTYTNLTASAVTEEVTMQYETYTAQGCEYELIARVNGLQVNNNGVHNDCGGAASDSFTVQPGDTFSATVTHVAGGTSGFIITDWWENQ